MLKSVRDRLRRHPFGVKAFFQESLVLGYSVLIDELRPLVPACLEIDSYQGRHGFLAVALVDVKNLRPQFLPKFMGSDFTLIGYRIFVRYRGRDERKRRGLYILGSETDRSKMVRLGSLFTQYRYQKVGISWKKDVIETDEGLRVRRDPNAENVALPENSIFPDWRTARRFAGPMPFTFSYDEERKIMTTVEGVRSSWNPESVKIREAKVPFVDALGLTNVRLANAFCVKEVPYQWKKGETEACP